MTISKDYTVAYWQDLLAQYASDLPIEKLNAWMAEESEGFPQALGSSTEVGIFQVDLQDGPKYGGTTDTLHTNFCASATSQTRVRDLTDDEETLQVTSGLAMVREYYADAQSRLAQANAQWSDDDTWNLTKLHHALPALRLLTASASSNGRLRDWGDFRDYVLGLSVDQVAATGVMSASTAQRYYPYTRFFDNAEAVGYTDGGGLVGGGGLSQMGKALVAIAIMFGVLYYGGRYGIPV